MMLALGSLLLGGCAVQGRLYQRQLIPPRKSVVYVYRPYSYAGSLVRPRIRCGRSAAVIGPGGYHAFVEDAGTIVCKAETETKDEVEIQARPGREYYVRYEIGWGLWVGHPHLHPIDQDRAQTEIEQCCRLQS